MSELEAMRLPELSNYRILQALGQGGMGSVFLGQRHGTTDLSVIKVVNEEHLENDSVGQRFLREAHVAANLDHPNIARLTDAGREGGRFYLVMEFIPGRELEQLWHQLLRRQQLTPPGLTLTIAQHVLRGLQYAHSLHDSNGLHLAIVHRDLSPRNVMLTYDGEVKIIDFGLVRTALGEWRTKPGMLMGTLRYISPEQAAGMPVDHRADLYTVAVVLYELLSGVPMIPDGEPKEILHNIFNLVPPPLRDMNPGLPDALTPIFQKALQRGADDRFPNAEAFAAALYAAAPDLSSTPPDQIGAFVADQFPAEAAWARDVQRQAKLQEHTLVGDAPELVLTRAGIPDMAAADEPAFEATRAGQLEDLALPISVTEAATFAPAPAPLAPPPDPARRWLLPAGLAAVAVLVLLALLALERPPEEREISEVAEVADVRPPPSPAPKPVPAPTTPGVSPSAREPAAPTAAEVPQSQLPAKRRPARKAKTTAPTKPPPASAPSAPAAPDPRRVLATARARLAKDDFEGAARALRRASKLEATHDAAIASCIENAEFVNRTRPDYGLCAAKLAEYLEEE